jgi:hypothetical protein
MKPQPPVTKMRIAARTSSGHGGALAHFPALRDKIDNWKTALAESGWTPWLIIALAAFLRLLLLAIKPAHFDEGINGWFVDQVVKNGFYRYDPTNYHGPLHFYVLLLSEKLLGRNLWALRLPVVLVSIGCVWLTLKFEPLVGRSVSRLAALAMAVSPGFIFYGRYSIHEVWLQLFSMLFILGVLGLWKFGTASYLWCAGMGIAGMILTKETYIIHLGCAVIAFPVLLAINALPEPFLISRPVKTKSIIRPVGAQRLIPFFAACLLVAFLMPWVEINHVGSSGLELAKLGSYGNYAWLIPIFATLTIVVSVSKTDNRVIGGLTGGIPLVALLYLYFRIRGEAGPEATIELLKNAPHVLGIGAYLAIVASLCLIFAAVIPRHVRFGLKAPDRLPDSRAASKNWDTVDLAIVLATGTAFVVFFYSGTFFHWSGVKGIYQAYTAWFATGSEGHGHEKPWYYWLKTMAPSFERGRADYLGYELPAMAGLLLCLAVFRLKNFSLRYLAVYGVGTLMVYSYVNYKTPWCVISFLWPFLFLFGGALLLAPLKYDTRTIAVLGGLLCTALGADLCYWYWVSPEYGWSLSFIVGLALLLAALRYRQALYALVTLSLSVSVVSAVSLNYFRYTADNEPYVYVQTYEDINKLTKPLLTLAKRDPLKYQLIGHIIRTSAYPLPWILGDFVNVGYYEHDNLPEKLDAAFLLVQEDKIKTVEAKLHESYYTDTVRIRAYQEPSKLYLNTKVFADFFPGRQPDFKGKPQS